MKKTLTALALFAATATPVLAADNCAATIEGNDKMQYNIKAVEIPKSCKTFTMTLKHVGKMPKVSMGHNIVVTKASDAKAVATDGIKAKATDYVKPDDARVLAHTKMIGGGESASLTLDVSKMDAGTEYTYFCSFPGHATAMKGTLKIGG